MDTPQNSLQIRMRPIHWHVLHSEKYNNNGMVTSKKFEQITSDTIKCNKKNKTKQVNN